MIKPTFTLLTAAIVAAVTLSGPAQGQRRESLSDRLDRLEAMINESGDSEAQDTLADLVIQIGELQQEVRELRGLVEEQQFAYENLRKIQLDQYLELDGRMVQAEQRLSGVPATGFGPPPGDTMTSGFESNPDQPDQVIASDQPNSAVVTAQTGYTGEFPEVREEVDAQLQTSGLGATNTAPVTALVDPAAEKAAYDEAFDALRNGRYAESSRLFSAFLEQYPDGEFADNAQYWLGESYYVTRNYRVALEAFQTLLSRFPNSTKTPDARLKIGLSHYSLKDWEAAERELNSVINDYPDTTVSRLAQNRLRAMRIDGNIQ